MNTSKTIAGLIGPTLVAMAASMLLNVGSFPALAEQVSHDPSERCEGFGALPLCPAPAAAGRFGRTRRRSPIPGPPSLVRSHLLRGGILRLGAKRRRHRNSNEREMPYRRAVAATRRRKLSTVIRRGVRTPIGVLIA